MPRGEKPWFFFIPYPTNNIMLIPQQHIVFCRNTLILLLSSFEIICKVMRLIFYIKKRRHTSYRSNQLRVYMLFMLLSLEEEERQIHFHGLLTFMYKENLSFY